MGGKWIFNSLIQFYLNHGLVQHGGVYTRTCMLKAYPWGIKRIGHRMPHFLCKFADK
jgi:hypothetical protein